MRRSFLVCTVLSLFFNFLSHGSGLLEPSRLSHSETSRTLVESPRGKTFNLTTIIWPPSPFKIYIPRRKGNQYILITSNDRMDHGDRARNLGLGVCDQMMAWLMKLPGGAVISNDHWESRSYGEYHATEYSVFMSLDPANKHRDRQEDSLDREIAFFAIEEFRKALAVHGAMEGEFEIWAYGHKRSTSVFHTFKWPANDETS